jgi:hypothetical protein
MRAATRCIYLQTGADSKVGESPFRRRASARSLQVFASTEIREIEDLSQVVMRCGVNDATKVSRGCA